MTAKRWYLNHRLRISDNSLKEFFICPMMFSKNE
nr:MAG TPA: hypothetical protein [Caudoviricetes sp.]